MLDDQYIHELESKLVTLVSNIRERYRVIEEQSENIVSLYDFNHEIDDIASLIESFCFYKKQLEKAKRNDYSYFYKPAVLTPEEQQEIKHNQLVVERTIIEELITSLDNAIATMRTKPKLYRLLNRLEMNRFKLTSDLQNIKSQLRIYEAEPDYTDGEIDIYIQGSKEQIEFQAVIYLHDTSKEIGEITYRGPDNQKWLGDIGYTISSAHQGNNYAYKALCLIAPLILEKGIDKVLITTYFDNIASKKTIEKFGGTLKETILGNVLIYECDLTKILTVKLSYRV